MKRKKPKRLTVWESIFLITAGLILGIAFTFGMPYWSGPVSRDEAIPATATIQSIEEQYGQRHHLKEVRVEFQDRDPLYIDGSCARSDLLEALRQISTGTAVSLRIHPNSNTILDMQVDGISLMDFEQSVKTLNTETTGFMYVGIFCFLTALVGLVNLYLQRKR